MPDICNKAVAQAPRKFNNDRTSANVLDIDALAKKNKDDAQAKLTKLTEELKQKDAEIKEKAAKIESLQTEVNETTEKLQNANREIGSNWPKLNQFQYLNDRLENNLESDWSPAQVHILDMSETGTKTTGPRFSIDGSKGQYFSTRKP
jgi:chromosome segregation ATPase